MKNAKNGMLLAKKRILSLISLLLLASVLITSILVTSVLAVGEITDKLVQKNIGDYNYISADIDKKDGDINYQYIAFYKKNDADVRVDVYELYTPKDAEEMFSGALKEGNLVDVNNKKVGLNTDVNHNLFWNSGNFLVSIEFPKDVSESDPLLQEYLTKYPLNIITENPEQDYQTNGLIKKDIGNYVFINEDIVSLEGGDKRFTAMYQLDDLEAEAEITQVKDSKGAKFLFDKGVKDENSELITVKNMNLAKRVQETASGDRYEYMWHNANKIIILYRLDWESINDDLLVLEYLSKYPSEVNTNSANSLTPTPVYQKPMQQPNSQNFPQNNQQNCQPNFQPNNQQGNMQNFPQNNMQNNQPNNQQGNVQNFPQNNLQNNMQNNQPNNQQGNQQNSPSNCQPQFQQNFPQEGQNMGNNNFQTDGSQNFNQGFNQGTPNIGAPNGMMCKGCKVDNNCLDIGFRMVSENIPKYCDVDSTLYPQKDKYASCQNNFECLSNQCSNSKCIDLSSQLEETQGLLQKILDWIKGLVD